MKIRYILALLAGVAASVTLAVAAGAATPSPSTSAAASPSTPASSSTPATSPSVGIGGLAEHHVSVVGAPGALPGDSLEITSTGWPAHRHARVTFDNGAAIASVPTNAGTIDAHVTIPATAAPGAHTLNLLVHTDNSTPGEQNTFDDEGQVRIMVLHADVAVEPTTTSGGPIGGADGPTSTSSGLAFTGTRTAGVAGAGVLLVAAGAGLSVLASRRRAARHTP